jgi:hypothetical protein
LIETRVGIHDGCLYLSVYPIKKSEDPHSNKNCQGYREAYKKTSPSISEDAPEGKLEKVEVLVVEHGGRGKRLMSYLILKTVP